MDARIDPAAGKHTLGVLGAEHKACLASESIIAPLQIIVQLDSERDTDLHALQPSASLLAMLM